MIFYAASMFTLCDSFSLGFGEDYFQCFFWEKANEINFLPFLSVFTPNAARGECQRVAKTESRWLVKLIMIVKMLN